MEALRQEETASYIIAVGTGALSCAAHVLVDGLTGGHSSLQRDEAVRRQHQQLRVACRRRGRLPSRYWVRLFFSRTTTTTPSVDAPSLLCFSAS